MYSFSSPHGPDDKVKIEYDVFLNRSEKHVMVLQFPTRNRDQPYNARSGQRPTELRIKPKSGLVELDIPMTIDKHFDPEKGIRFGQAINKSKLLQQGGSYGLAGGLGSSVHSRSARYDVRASAGPAEEVLIENFEDSNNKGYVMNKITLGGRITKPENGKSVNYIGIFKGSE